jgi:hypothetical protein
MRLWMLRPTVVRMLEEDSLERTVASTMRHSEEGATDLWIDVNKMIEYANDKK